MPKTQYTTRGLARQELRRARTRSDECNKHMLRVINSHRGKVDDEYDVALAMTVELLENLDTLLEGLHDRI